MFGLGYVAPAGSSPILQTLKVRGPGLAEAAGLRGAAVVSGGRHPGAATLVLGPHGDPDEALEQGLPWPSWVFVLRRRLGERTTRLIVRVRSDFKLTLAGVLANKYGLEPVHFLMERKMLIGY